MPATSTSPPGPRERARSARRTALLETAEQVFAERGFAGATMAEIAARAGYSAGNLYNSFESKEDLYREVMLTSGKRFTEALLGALHEPGTFRERLDRHIDAFLGFGENHRDFFVILSQPAGNFEWGTDVLFPEAEAIRNQVENEMMRFYANGIADGALPDGDPGVYMNLAGGALSAHVAGCIRRGGEPEDLWRSTEQLRAALHRALGVKP